MITSKFSPEVAGDKANVPAHQLAMLKQAKQHFVQTVGDSRDVIYAMAPGRVNLIGEHTDYNDGFALPMTVDSGVYWAIRKRSDERVHLYSVRFDDHLEYSLQDVPELSQGAWSSYVCGVVEELRQRGFVNQGFEGVVLGDLPLGAGLSSSAALEVATAIALQGLFDFRLSPVGMVQLCQHVEHIYAGVECGIMDQFACRIGKRHHALLLDCRSHAHEDVLWALGDKSIVIIESGVQRSLSSSKYNERRAECLQAVSMFQSIDTAVKSLRDVTTEFFERHKDRLTTTLEKRGRHVISENQRVLDSADALRSGDFRLFGSLMNESHASLRDDYEVSCVELDFLVSVAQETDGVHGARMTGAGFGGCTVNIVDNDAIESFSENINLSYSNRFGRNPPIFVLGENVEAGVLTYVNDSAINQFHTVGK